MFDDKAIDEILLDFIEVKLNNVDDDFFKIRETLTRIGVASTHKKVLYQTCHILRKRNKYFIVHFKELFKLDSKPSSFNDEDRIRRNVIANLLQEWKFLEIIDTSKTQVASNNPSLLKIKIIPYKEKSEWLLCAKYQIGKNKTRSQKFDDLK